MLQAMFLFAYLNYSIGLVRPAMAFPCARPIRSRHPGYASIRSDLFVFPNNLYGKGSEIWPPTNVDTRVQLKDSFPGGVIPPEALQAMAASDARQALQHPLDQPTWLDRLPGVFAILSLAWIRPLDVGLVATLSIYTALLTMIATSIRENTQSSSNDRNEDSNAIPTLPNLPPQGHVPLLVQNPMLGLSFSKGYELWFKLGIGLGFVLPVLSIVWTLLSGSFSSSYSLVTIVARPLLLLSCQAISEFLGKDWLLPLPIQIWIPISYQITRLIYLGWGLIQLFTLRGMIVSTASSSSVSSRFFLSLVKALTGLNLLYTVSNVFGFLLPVALMRYMRAHFFAVEAASVSVHKGLEETIGLFTIQQSASDKTIMSNK